MTTVIVLDIDHRLPYALPYRWRAEALQCLGEDRRLDVIFQRAAHFSVEELDRILLHSEPEDWDCLELSARLIRPQLPMSFPECRIKRSPNDTRGLVICARTCHKSHDAIERLVQEGYHGFIRAIPWGWIETYDLFRYYPLETIQIYLSSRDVAHHGLGYTLPNLYHLREDDDRLAAARLILRSLGPHWLYPAKMLRQNAMYCDDQAMVTLVDRYLANGL